MAYELDAKRSRDLAAVAGANRLTFTEHDSIGASSLLFTPMRQSPRGRIQNVLTGRTRGRTVQGFDFGYEHDPASIPGPLPPIPYENRRPLGCALIWLDAPVPAAHFYPRSRRHTPSGDEVRISDKALAKLYQLWSPDPVRAQGLLTPGVRAFLTGTKGQFNFELGQGGVLAIVETIRPPDFPAFMAMLVRFADELSAAVAAAPPDAPLAPGPAPVPVAAPEPTPVMADTLSQLLPPLPPPPPDAASHPLPPPPPDAATAPLPPAPV